MTGIPYGCEPLNDAVATSGCLEIEDSTHHALLGGNEVQR